MFRKEGINRENESNPVSRKPKGKGEKKEEEREKERGGREGEKKGEKNSRVIELRCLIGLMRRWTRNDGSNPLFEEVEPVRKIH